MDASDTYALVAAADFVCHIGAIWLLWWLAKRYKSALLYPMPLMYALYHFYSKHTVERTEIYKRMWGVYGVCVVVYGVALLFLWVSAAVRSSIQKIKTILTCTWDIQIFTRIASILLFNLVFVCFIQGVCRCTYGGIQLLTTNFTHGCVIDSFVYYECIAANVASSVAFFMSCIIMIIFVIHMGLSSVQSQKEHAD